MVLCDFPTDLYLATYPGPVYGVEFTEKYTPNRPLATTALKELHGLNSSLGNGKLSRAQWLYELSGVKSVTWVVQQMVIPFTSTGIHSTRGEGDF